MPHTATRRHAPRARHATGRSRWRRTLTALGVTAAVLLVAGSVSGFVAYWQLNGNITKEDVSGLIKGPRPDKVVVPDAPKEPLNILVMGSDERTGKAADNPDTAGRRSDTTILVHLAADRESATLVSIPRDTIVAIPECTREDGARVPERSAEMINVAFSDAGAACTIQTVERLTGIYVDHHVVIDFRGFKDMVNALGGVRICLPQDVNDPDSHLALSKGEHVVKGQQALAYVRTRKGLGNGGDLSRIDRQHAFLGSMVSKVQDKGLLLRPDRLLSFLGAATNSLTTDPDLGNLNALRKLALEVRGISTGNIEFLTAPNEAYPADPNRVQLTPAAETLWDALRLDQPLPGSQRARQASARGATPTPSPTGEPLITAPERIKVRVLNGSGLAGEASRVAADLTAQGFQVIGVGNADRTDYLETEVRHDPAYDESGRTLGAAVTGSVVVEGSTLGATLVVVVGADSPEVVPVEATGTPGASTPSPTATLATRSADQDICT